MAANKFRVTATSANWNVTYFECRVTLDMAVNIYDADREVATTRRHIPGKVGLMTHLETLCLPIRLNSSDQTFYGTQIRAFYEAGPSSE